MKQIFILISVFLPGILQAQSSEKVPLNDLAARAEATHSEALIVYRGDDKLLEKYFGIGHPDTLIEAMSATKSIVGLAVACMLDDKYLDGLDTPVYKFYPEWNQGLKQKITVRHLVNMTSGIQNVPNTSVEIYPSPDFIQLALAADLVSTPGTEFSYNNKSVNLLAGVIQKATGKPMDKYIGERLFKPLGITHYDWSQDPSGHPQAMAGCQIRPADMAKIGLLMLNQGRLGQQVIISASSWSELARPCPLYKGYSMLWWLDYERSLSIVDDQLILDFKKAGVPLAFIQKAEKLKGEYTNDPAYVAKVNEVFGPTPLEYINNTLGPLNLRLRKRKFEGHVRYRADGYLGNFVIVDPDTRIVAVRMISSNSHKDDKDDFGDFKDMVYRLRQ